ncbi:MAG: hypothetical protein JNK72_01870 [Myxococcales bacterium]|nr:hypothetical protein [Myxococcales bacterium]
MELRTLGPVVLVAALVLLGLRFVPGWWRRRWREARALTEADDPAATADLPEGARAVDTVIASEPASARVTEPGSNVRTALRSTAPAAEGVATVTVSALTLCFDGDVRDRLQLELDGLVAARKGTLAELTAQLAGLVMRHLGAISGARVEHTGAADVANARPQFEAWLARGRGLDAPDGEGVRADDPGASVVAVFLVARKGGPAWIEPPTDLRALRGAIDAVMRGAGPVLALEVLFVPSGLRAGLSSAARQSRFGDLTAMRAR